MTWQDLSSSEKAALSNAFSSLDFSLWFKDTLAVQHFNSFSSQYAKTKSEEEQAGVASDAAAIIALYSVMIYKIYPHNPRFKDQIDFSPELTRNFKHMKAWLDEHEGEAIADEFFSKLSSAKFEGN